MKAVLGSEIIEDENLPQETRLPKFDEGAGTISRITARRTVADK
jgi:hypothetical protein